MLQIKKKKWVCRKFGENSFVCANRWLDRLKKGKNISSGKIVGEVANIFASDVEKWKAQVWADAIQDYKEKDIFNADNDGAFYKMTPDQTLKFKGEKCSNEKLSEVRITVLVAQISTVQKSEN